MERLKTKYLEFISESRYKTHGLRQVKKMLPRILDYINCSYKIEYNDITDDFGIYFYDIDDVIKDILIERCEVLGYFPAVFTIDGEQMLTNSKNIDEFVENIKKIKLPEKYNVVYFQFECWMNDVVETPKILYHVFRTVNSEKIKIYGLCPKAKNKISYHPDRIYLSSTMNGALTMLSSFKKQDRLQGKIEKYSLAIIDTSIPMYTSSDNKPPKDYIAPKILVRKDSNFDDGYYTTQNISSLYITEIINY